MNPNSDRASTEVTAIEVSAAHIRYLNDRFEQRMMRAPTSEETEKMVEQHVRDEIYYREAVRMGLGSDDPLIRRRMRQKLNFILLDTAALIAPDKEQLQQYMQQHAERYMTPARVSFQQVYLGEADETSYAELIKQLESGEFQLPASPGLMLQDHYQSIPTEVIERRFGAKFAEMLVMQPIASWQAPLYSGFGAHAVRLEHYEPAALPELDDQYDAVLQDWLTDRTASMQEQIYQDLSNNYQVVIEFPEVAPASIGIAE